MGAPPPIRRSYLGIGSNLGDRLAFLQGAVDALARTEGIGVVAVSAVYETTPVGPDQPDYLNAVVAADTALPVRALLAVAQHLESEAGRVRAERWGPRTLDVDVLLVGDETVDTPDLQVPHPRLRERAFVLVPLADLDRATVARLAPVLAADLAGAADRAGVRATGLHLRVPE
jgi:2-amino-4-hydroxy-6-hydroxymethyldihydropteridine diphosphokinase